jgi:hypothetical protein
MCVIGDGYYLRASGGYKLNVVLVALHYLSASDTETRIMLRDSYHLTSTLTGLLLDHNSRSSSNESIIFQVCNVCMGGFTEGEGG